MDKDKILDLILFLKDKEYRIDNNEEIIVWLNFYDIQEFTDIFGYEEFCEGGKDVILLNESIAFNLYDFIDGIDEEDIQFIIKRLEKYNSED